MENTFAKKGAACIFYGGLTLLPTLVWIVANHSEKISFEVLASLTVMPMVAFYFLRGILEEAPRVVANSGIAQAMTSGESIPG